MQWYHKMWYHTKNIWESYNYKEIMQILGEMRSQYDVQFEYLYTALEKLINPPTEPRPRIGFRRANEMDWSGRSAHNRTATVSKPNNHHPENNTTNWLVVSERFGTALAVSLTIKGMPINFVFFLNGWNIQQGPCMSMWGLPFLRYIE